MTRSEREEERFMIDAPKPENLLMQIGEVYDDTIRHRLTGATKGMAQSAHL